MDIKNKFCENKFFKNKSLTKSFIFLLLLSFSHSIKPMAKPLTVEEQINTCAEKTFSTDKMVGSFKSLPQEERSKLAKLLRLRAKIAETYVGEKVAARYGEDSPIFDNVFDKLLPKERCLYFSLNIPTLGLLENIETILSENETCFNFNNLLLLFQARKSLADKFKQHEQNLKHFLTHTRYSKSKKPLQIEQLCTTISLQPIFLPQSIPLEDIQYLDTNIISIDSMDIIKDIQNQINAIITKTTKRLRISRSQKEQLLKTQESGTDFIKNFDRTKQIQQELQSNLVQTFEQSLLFRQAYTVVHDLLLNFSATSSKKIFTFNSLVRCKPDRTLLDHIKITLKDIIFICTINIFHNYGAKNISVAIKEIDKFQLPTDIKNEAFKDFLEEQRRLKNHEPLIRHQFQGDQIYILKKFFPIFFTLAKYKNKRVQKKPISLSFEISSMTIANYYLTQIETLEKELDATAIDDRQKEEEKSKQIEEKLVLVKTVQKAPVCKKRYQFKRLTNELFRTIFSSNRIIKKTKDYAIILQPEEEVTSLIYLNPEKNDLDLSKFQFKKIEKPDKFHQVPFEIKKYLNHSHIITTENMANAGLHQHFFHKLRLNPNQFAIAVEAKILPKYSYDYYANQSEQTIRNTRFNYSPGMFAGAWVFIIDKNTLQCTHQCFHEFAESHALNQTH